jgi:hypothetical protein
MGVLTELASSTEQPPRSVVPAVDPALGDPTAAEMRDELARGSYQRASQVLAATKDPNLRAFYVSALEQWEGRPEILERWKQEEPDDPAAWLVCGAHSIQWAWEARGGGKGDTVGAEAAERFRQRLEQATAELSRAADLDPDDPTPYALLIMVCVGLNRPKELTLDLFEEARRRCPDHLLAHRNLLTYLCRKWHGSHEEMFAFARQSSKRAPEGSLLPMLVAEAHCERWLYAAHFDQEPDANQYFLLMDVRKELVAEYGFSLGSSRHQPGPLTRLAANYFAYTLGRGGLLAYAPRAFAQMEGQVNYLPWAYGGDPVESYQRCRDWIDEECRVHAQQEAAAARDRKPTEKPSVEKPRPPAGPRERTAEHPLGSVVLRCRKCSPAVAWRELGGSWLGPILVPPLIALVLTLVFILGISEMTKSLNLPHNPLWGLLAIVWFAGWAAGMYYYYFTAPGAGSFDLHEHGFRYRDRQVRFTDLARISLGRVRSGIGEALGAFSRIVAQFSDKARRAVQSAENSERSSLTLRFKDGSSWSMNNVLAEYEQTDLEQFVTRVFSQHPELNGIRTEEG